MASSKIDNEKINLYFNGEYTEKDESYVYEVFCDNSKEKELKHLLSRQFNELLHKDDMNKKDLDDMFYKLYYRINTKIARKEERKFKGFFNWSLRIAGIVILPLIVFFGVKGYFNYNAGKETSIEIKAPAWTRVQFSLPDGTIGWLNSNSSLKYNGNFNADRQLTLNGEAYFDVFKDKNRPFKVQTKEVIVKAIGTRFNIASYENENKVEVVLEEGKLQFNAKGENNSYMMRPNDLIIYDKTLKSTSTEIVQTQKYSSWKEGMLIFRNDPLDVIVRRLERWYNIDIEVNGSQSDDIRLRATFCDERLEEVLEILKRSLSINFRIENQNLKPNDIYTKKKVIIYFKSK